MQKLVGACPGEGGRITLQRIQGAVAVYLLLGRCLHVADLDLLQFRTLTTMGYGDITPVHPIARSLTVLEALTGQLYLTITLTRLVGLQLASREDG